MFRDMRRKAQILSEVECKSILKAASSGVLAVSGDDGYPYAVPLSFVYDNGSIFFHCAGAGHKYDAIKSCDKASFCVIAQHAVVPEEYTTYFKSVIAFGRVNFVDGDERLTALEKLALKYYPDDNAQHREMSINKELSRVVIVELKIEHMTGKQAIELKNADARNQ